jgi:quinoprotein glucose dehydrogenase
VDPDGVLYVNANEMAWLESMSDTPKESALDTLSPGHRVYALYCQACHGPERKGMAASSVPSLVGIGTRMKPDDILATITTGRKMMPGFTTLSKGDRAALLAFLLGTEQAGETSGPEGQSAVARIPYRFDGYNRWVDSRGYPATTPPWGTLTAINLNIGEQVWRVPLGDFPDLPPKGHAPTGCENYGGPVSTAGGLLFIAATKDGMMRAFDKRDGRILWEARLPAGGFATPCTYLVDGRQYVAVACGGTKLDTPTGDSYVAFALP